jgi:hypothetical protein
LVIGSLGSKVGFWCPLFFPAVCLHWVSWSMLIYELHSRRHRADVCVCVCVYVCVCVCTTVAKWSENYGAPSYSSVLGVPGAEGPAHLAGGDWGANFSLPL